MIPTFPPLLSNGKRNQIAENYDEKEISYDKLYPESSFPQKVDNNKSFSSDNLPLKLYNIEGKKKNLDLDIKNIAELANKHVRDREKILREGITSYATLSYV